MSPVVFEATEAASISFNRLNFLVKTLGWNVLNAMHKVGEQVSEMRFEYFGDFFYLG